MQGSIVNQGVELMLFGMGTVLAFLTVLVLAITLMSWILQRYFPVVEASPAQKSSLAPASTALSDANLIAVITAAIHQHKAKHPRD